MNDTEFLTTAEAAAIIRMRPDYVSRQCHAGNLRAKRLGKEWRIRRTDLEAFMSGDPAPVARAPRLSARQMRRAVS